MTLTQAIDIINDMILHFPDISNSDESFEALVLAKDTMERVQAYMVRFGIQQMEGEVDG